MKLKHQGSLVTSESSSEPDEEEDEVEPLELPQQGAAGASLGPGVSPRPRSSLAQVPQEVNFSGEEPGYREGRGLLVTDLDYDEEEEDSTHQLHGRGRRDRDDEQEEAAGTFLLWPDDSSRSQMKTSPVDDHQPERWWSEVNGVATVKLVLESGVGVITRAWPLSHTILTLKTQLSHTTQVPPHFLQLVLRGRVLSDEVTLRDVGVEANETVQVGVSSRRPHSHPLILLAPAPPLTTPDVITVIVSQGGGVEREVVVEVEWRCGEKAWLGGLRHKISGRHYHHAATQTSHLTKPPPVLTTRGTQTVATTSRGCQTRRATCTQTSDLHPLLTLGLAEPPPRLLTPKPYSPAPTYDVTKVSLIQRLIRGWIARRRVRLLRQMRERDMVGIISVSGVGESASPLPPSPTHSVTTIASSITSPRYMREERTIPITELYERLEAWRRRQVSQVNESLTGRERRRALVALLDKETELLRSLQEHRNARSSRRRNQALTNFLYEVSQAQVWEVCGGRVGVVVQTPDTQPIRTLATLATSLMQDATPQLRAHHLNLLITTVESYRPSLEIDKGGCRARQRVASEISSLSSRGLDLLSRGTSDTRLRGLRKRLHTLLITYLHLVQSRVPSVVAPRCVRAAGAKPVLSPSRQI